MSAEEGKSTFSGEKMDSVLQISKTKWEIRKFTIEVFALSLAAIYVLAFSIGGLFSIIYLWRLQFTPGGITASDTAPFAQLMVAVLITTSLALLFSTFVSFPLAKLVYLLRVPYKWIERKFRAKVENSLEAEAGPRIEFRWKEGNGMPLIGTSLFLVLILILLWYGNISQGIKQLALILLVAGIFLSFTAFGNWEVRYCKWEKGMSLSWSQKWVCRKSGLWRSILICIILTPALLLVRFGVAQDVAMAVAGIRKHNVTIKVSEDDFNSFLKIANDHGLAVNPCESIDSSAHVLSNVDVLWHRIGTEGLLSYPSEELGAINGNEVPLKKFTLEASNAALETAHQMTDEKWCAEFLSDTVFDSTGLNITPRGQKLLNHELKRINFPLDRQIHVRAHSFTRTAPPGTNETPRTLLQAHAIGDYLVKALKVSNGNVDAIGREDSELKQECDAITSSIAKRRCVRSNNRIEIFWERL